jgi:hypothetical protein
LPTGKSIQQLGGWARVSPNDKNPVYAYVDTVKGVKINVSEQPLPSTFQTDPEGSLATLASQFNANQKIDLGDATAYLGNASDGVQSVIFAKDNLLVLIRAASQLPNDSWIEYIDSLE